MKCDFVYCLYYGDGKCTLPESDHEIDNIGNCASCTIMQLDTDFLDKERARQLHSMICDD